MVSIVESILLGIIQGLTEWLPVSSSGHLAAAKEFLNLQPPLIFYALLHVGTLSVVVTFFRKDILKILRAVAKGDFKSENGRFGISIIIGSVPTAAIGYVFKEFLESSFNDLLIVGSALLVTGFSLFVSGHREGNKKLGFADSLLVGLAQGAALIPGLSRSGVTISTGLLRGVDKEKVFRFSFLLSIPAILGATFLEFKDLNIFIDSQDMAAAILGVTASIIIGYLSLNVLRKLIIEQRFHWFAVYCWIAGLILIASQTL